MMNPHRILAALLCAAWLAPSLAAGRPLADLLGDATFWQQLDWQQAGSSAIWQERNWVSYLGKQSGPLTHDHIQALRLDGTEWQATLDQRTGSQPSAQLTVYTPADESQQDRCNQLFNWASNHFGTPRVAVDGSYRLVANGATAQHAYTDRHYQWDLGNTRITADCQGQIAEDGSTVYAASSLRFSALSASSEIHPLVRAKCSRTLRLTDSSDIPLKMSDIVFIIDENNGSIRRPDLVPIRVHQVQVGHELINFSLTLDKSTNDYQITLPSGQLTAAMSISGVHAGQVSGVCSLTPLSPAALTKQQAL